MLAQLQDKLWAALENSIQLCPGLCEMESDEGRVLILNTFTCVQLENVGNSLLKTFPSKYQRIQALGEFDVPAVAQVPPFSGPVGQTTTGPAADLRVNRSTPARQRFTRVAETAAALAANGRLVGVETHDFFHAHMTHMCELFRERGVGQPCTTCLLYVPLGDIPHSASDAWEFFNALVEYGLLMKGVTTQPTTGYVEHLTRRQVLDVVDGASGLFTDLDSYDCEVMSTIVKRFLLPVLGFTSSNVDAVWVVTRHPYDIILAAGKHTPHSVARSLAGHIRNMSRTRRSSLLLTGSASAGDEGGIDNGAPVCVACCSVVTALDDPSSRQHARLPICGQCLDIARSSLETKKSHRLGVPTAPQLPQSASVNMAMDAISGGIGGLIEDSISQSSASELGAEGGHLARERLQSPPTQHLPASNSNQSQQRPARPSTRSTARSWWTDSDMADNIWNPGGDDSDAESDDINWNFMPRRHVPAYGGGRGVRVRGGYSVGRQIGEEQNGPPPAARGIDRGEEGVEDSTVQDAPSSPPTTERQGEAEGGERDEGVLRGRQGPAAQDQSANTNQAQRSEADGSFDLSSNGSTPVTPEVGGQNGPVTGGWG